MTADPPSITFGHDESWDCRGSESGAHGEALLADVGACVPLTPDLGWGEHASATAHVTEGSLTRAVGTTSSDTGDTGDGTSCTPRFSTGLVTWKNGCYQGAHIKFVDVFNKIKHLYYNSWRYWQYDQLACNQMYKVQFCCPSYKHYESYQKFLLSI